MNTIGIHGMVWVGGFSKPEAEHAITSSAATGYSLIELPPVDPGTIDVEYIRGLLADNGLAISATLGLDEATDVSSTDQAVVQAGRERLLGALHMVTELGGNFLGGVIYSKLGRYAEPVSETGRANSVESITQLADEAAKSGITIGLEVVNRYETNVMNTVQEGLAFIKDVGRDNVTLHLDTYHMNIEERSFRDAIHAAHDAGKLGYFHVGESHRGQLGTGSVPWDETFSSLAEVGYDGVITFESFSSKVVHPTLSSTLAIWRNTWEDSYELASGARGFLRTHIA
ncbi:sugar phosphate isomerase/epimerase family protein [Arthrobacter citreus]|uniref:Sugar phosphate isomerase/epimerase family protein n=1 Tax=Arthrobacter citreus TaxID=1670 RepID=A0ABZ2ZVX9_9MICC